MTIEYDNSPILVGDATFEINVDISGWMWEDSIYINHTGGGYKVTVPPPPRYYGNLMNDEDRPQVLAQAVSWFKSEDLGLLYKVLDDPAAFGIAAIECGSFFRTPYCFEGLEPPARAEACIVGALAIAKAPKDATVREINELASNITGDGSIFLTLLDNIIDLGHLGEFKAEIQRQMLER